MHPKMKFKDRRGAERFSMECEIQFKELRRRAGAGVSTGRTINMSSRGMLFSCNQPLVPGRDLEVSVNWPVKLNSTIPLKMVARCRVVRFDGCTVAVEIKKYEFRTQAIPQQVEIHRKRESDRTGLLIRS